MIQISRPLIGKEEIPSVKKCLVQARLPGRNSWRNLKFASPDEVDIVFDSFELEIVR